VINAASSEKSLDIFPRAKSGTWVHWRNFWRSNHSEFPATPVPLCPSRSQGAISYTRRAEFE